MTRSLGAAAQLALLAAVLAYPWLVPGFWVYQIGAQSLVLGTIALSLSFLAGYGGMVSLAQVTVAGLAGYTIALTSPNGVGLGVPLPWPWRVGAALAVGTLAGTFVGLLALCTRGIQTIMITLAIAVGVFYLTQQNHSVFNGFTGFNRVVPPTVMALDFGLPLPFYYLSAGVAIAAYAGLWHLARTPFGLALQGLRDSPRRLAALGFHPPSHGVAAFAVAGFVAAAGGVLSVWYFQRISPGSIGIGPSINILVIAVIGGLGHPLGAFAGALLFTIINNFAIDLIDRERFNTLIGLTFLVVVLLSPDGLVGLWRRARSTAAAGPRWRDAVTATTKAQGE